MLHNKQQENENQLRKVSPLIDLKKLNKKSFSLKALTQINKNNITLQEIVDSANTTPRKSSGSI